jgi:hypothetical protein
MGVTFPSVRLPHVNRAAQLTINDSDYQDKAVEFELLHRMQLIFGSYLASRGSYGIVDEENPLTARDDMPMKVSAMNSNPLRLKVSAGEVVHKNGALSIVEALVEDIILPSTAANSVYVVYVGYLVLERLIRLDRFKNSVPTYYSYAADSDLIQVKSIADWNALTQADKDNSVPLAVVTVIENCPDGAPPTKSLVIDMTANTYSWNRPWFSPVDIQHRAERGSGGSDSTVPHGLTLDDLTSVGTIGLMDSMTKNGMIVSKASHQAKAPGQKCVETLLGRVQLVSALNFHSDPDANEMIILNWLGFDFKGLTRDIPFAYVELNGYPLPDHVVCWEDVDDDDDYELVIYNAGVQQQIVPGDNNYVFPCWVVPGTNLLVFPITADSITTATNPKVAYMDAVALRPPGGAAESLGTSLTFALPLEGKEAVICDGTVLTTLGNQNVSFADLGPLPSHYKVFAKKSSSATELELVRSPQPLLGLKKVTDISGTVDMDTQPLDAAYLRVGLAYGSIGMEADLVLDILISGMDEDGNSISETVSFVGTNTTPGDREYTKYRWEGGSCDASPSCLTGVADVGVPGSPEYYPNIHAHYWVRTSKKYAGSVTASVVTATKLRPEASIVIQALLDPADTPVLKRSCPVAEVSWSGSRVCQIRDVRPVGLTIDLPVASKQAPALAAWAWPDAWHSDRFQSVLSEGFEELRNTDVIRSHLCAEADSNASVRIRSHPLYGNKLLEPSDYFTANLAYLLETDAQLWVSRPTMLRSVLSHRNLVISLADRSKVNNVFTPTAGFWPGTDSHDDEVLVRFFVWDDIISTCKWTVWRRAFWLSGPIYIARVETYDTPTGSEYVFHGFQIAIRNYARAAGVLAWAGNLPGQYIIGIAP